MQYEARIKMVDKFVTRLRSDEYVYRDEASTELLVSLIYNAIYSLSRIDANDWKGFLSMFKEAKVTALNTVKDNEREENYNMALASLFLTFEKYVDYLRSMHQRTARPVNA